MKVINTSKINVQQSYLIIGVLFLIGLFLFFGVYRISIAYQSLFWTIADSLFTSFAVGVNTLQRTSVMEGITLWGHYGTIGIWILLSFQFFKRKQYHLLCMVIVLSLGGVGLGYGIKHIVLRERPIEHILIQETNSGFPSMHVLSSTLLYSFLVYVLYHFTHKFWISILSMFISLILIFAIGFSRIYLGVHFFSDCVAGLMLGIGYFFVTLSLFKLYCR